MEPAMIPQTKINVYYSDFQDFPGFLFKKLQFFEHTPGITTAG
jgi:hypothetical protein